MKAKILVVDDSPTDRGAMVEALKNENYEIVTATNGEEAVALAQSERPQLILLDVIMPETNGFQVCRRLKNADDTKDIRIILVTSKSQESDRYWGMRQGADNYVTKPFDANELREQVARFVQSASSDVAR